MIYTIFSLKDTTIYEKTESLNSGIDSILELKHELVDPSASLYNSRILMKFDLSELNEKINSNKIPTSSNYFLSLRTVDVQEVPQEYEIYAYPISSSWVNGTGQYNSQPILADGVSWKYRDSKTIGTTWEPTQSANPNVTGSFGKNVGGATWWTYENLVCSQSFNYNSSDLYMNVTPLINEWLTGSINNDGMLVKFSDTIEKMPESFSKIQFFSTDSNTIYVPRLHVCWDDSTFSTGSLTAVNLDNINLNVKLKKYYSFNENVKIKILANEKYPQKTYTTTAYSLKKYYLPETSYYEIRDAHSDEIIIPFNNDATKISCNSDGNYFYLWMNSFQPERFYRILIKVESDNGNITQIYDNNYYFKVTR
jgi:hypothetical protein